MKTTLLLSTVIGLLLGMASCATKQGLKTDAVSSPGSAESQTQSKNLSGVAKIGVPL